MSRRVLALSVAVGVGLRFSGLGRAPLTWDESVTALAARMPVGDLLRYLRNEDTHPPLDYLLRQPFARWGNEDWLLRLPSALLASAALVLFAWWMRDRGWGGVIATAVFALAPFQLGLAWNARMYAGMVFVGVSSAVLADRWLTAPSRRQLAGVAVAVGAGVFLHISGVLLAAGLVLLPGLRRDRAAWQWRAAVIAPVAVWAAAWGPVVLDQRHVDTASWIPYTSVDTFTRSLNELVTSFVPAAPLVTVGLAALVAVSAVVDRRGRVVVLAAFAVPVALAAVIGLRAHFLIPRTLAFASWAPAFLVGWAAVAAGRRVLVAGATVVGALAVVALPSLVRTIDAPADPGAARLRLATAAVGARAEAGDGVGAAPQGLATVVRWYVVPRDGGRELPMGDAADVIVLPGRPWTGRVVLLSDRADVVLRGFSSCGSHGVAGYWVHCKQLADA